MVVGTARLVLAIPGASSLKDKRSVLRRVIERAQAKFHAAIAEVEDQDVHRRAVVGIAVVSSDARHATSMLDTIVAFMAASSEAQVVSRRTDVRHVGEHDLADAPSAETFRLPGERDPWDDQDPDERP